MGISATLTPMSIFGSSRIYMDHASAPPVCAEALRAMTECHELIGNPGGIHTESTQAAQALNGARESIAALLSVKSREVIFTSGLTESNNLSILGFARALERKKRTLHGTHWLVSAIEHTSVLDCFAEIERMGGVVSLVMPDAKGRITADAVAAALKPDTVFVSVGWANNETGVIQQLHRIRQILDAHEKSHGTEIIFHSDAGQAPLYLSSTAHSLGVDLLALGSNKLYGPHGIGALHISTRTDIAKVLFGGPQERKLRPGTENVALALGFASAYELIASEREEESHRVRALRDAMAHDVTEKIPGLVINGDLSLCLPHMLNISIPDIQSEYVTLALDKGGVAVSTKSACREGEESRSHVVEALGGEAWQAQNTLRFSLGRGTTDADVKKAVALLVKIVSTRIP